MATKGKLLCSYPGPAVEVPANTFEDTAFLEEFSSFLVQMNVDIFDSAATTTKVGSTVVEERDSAHPRYITDLLTQILLGMGATVEIPRIRKRIADDILRKDASMPSWRRSPLWLMIRVALQTSLYSMAGNHIDYKAFMVFMMGNVLHRAVESQLPSDLLFCMRVKMSRRLYKLGTVAPDFVALAVEVGGGHRDVIAKKVVKGAGGSGTFDSPRAREVRFASRYPTLSSQQQPLHIHCFKSRGASTFVFSIHPFFVSQILWLRHF
jgi:hypothetical protein